MVRLEFGVTRPALNFLPCMPIVFDRLATTTIWLPVGVAVTQVRAEELVFNRDVRPILSETCFHCHGPDSV